MTDIIRLFGPLVLWLASFSAIYGLHGILCAQGGDRSLLVMAWIVTIVLQVGALVIVRSDRFGTREDFVRWISLALATVGIVAIVWTLAPVALLGACV